MIVAAELCGLDYDTILQAKCMARHVYILEIERERKSALGYHFTAPRVA